MRAEHVELDLDCSPDAADLDQKPSAELLVAVRDVIERMPLPKPGIARGSIERSVPLSSASDDVDILVDLELRGLVNDSVAASGLGPRHVRALMAEELNRALDEGRIALATDELDEQAPAATKAREEPPVIWGQVPRRRADFVGREELLAQLDARLGAPLELAGLPGWLAPLLESQAVLKAFLRRLIKLGRRSSAARQLAAECARLTSRSSAACSEMPSAGVVLLLARVPRGPNARRMASTQVIDGELVAAA
ncbi:hypothetical protein [Nocardia sp. NRRL S-836]|uniref:hypothetical protein n=1 Tax=Nocardia sp. NRRL S-836 TaxID=1519492 RepID=UPI000ADE6191|nr:hypothetical protein [Nocardia sp. NRRL S-836]